MTILVIAEHDNDELKAATLHALTAARRLNESVHILVAGSGAGAHASAASRAEGVSKVIHADAEHLKDGLAENIEPTVVSLSGDYSHIVIGGCQRSCRVTSSNLL